MNQYIYIFLVIIYEVLSRIIPTFYNLSITDKIKNIMLMIHNLLDIMIPNKIKNEE